MENNSTRYIAIGSMLFALFFGAGNLIFPAAMGQTAGANVYFRFSALSLSAIRAATTCAKWRAAFIRSTAFSTQ